MSDESVADVSESLRRPPPTRRRSTLASAPENLFTGPREARPAEAWRLAMSGHPCTPEAGAATDSASAPVHARGVSSAVGWINLTKLLLRRFASFESCCPSRFGDPKGDILRISSATGFNPAHRGRRPPKPIRAHLSGLRGRSRPQGLDRRLHHECRRGRCGRVPEGSADPCVRLGGRVLFLGLLRPLLARWWTCRQSEFPFPAYQCVYLLA